MNHLNNNLINALNSLNLREIKKNIRIIEKKNKSKPIIKIAITRTFTLEGQTDYLKLALNTLDYNLNLKIGNLNNIEQEINNLNSDIIKWKPDIIVVLWRIEELLPELDKNLNLPKNKFNNYFKIIKTRIYNLIKNFFRIYNCPLIISNLPTVQLGIKYNLNNDLRELIERINLFLLEKVRSKNNIYLFDFCGWSNSVGKNFLDLKMDLYAKQAVSSHYINSFALSLARTIRPLIRSSAKAVVVDLDNTLWGGILGEDGVENLNISHEFPGNIYRKIQTKILSLKKQGFLIFLISKNNLKDVEAAFKFHKKMPLKLADFNCIMVNWKEKHINLKKIAKEYNIGYSSFVFVDDQKFEQDQMRFNLKEVNVLDISEDPLDIYEKLDSCQLLDKAYQTKEDHLRSKDYIANTKRKNLKTIAKNSQDYLKSLSLKADIFKLNNKNIERAFEMVHKTNQFNLRTERYTKKELINIKNNNKYITLMISLSDRFGDQGIIGLICGKTQNEKIIFIENFLLSCRAIGRGAEEVLFYIFLKKLKNKKINIIKAEYLASEKNSQVKNLYLNFGMQLITKTKNKIFYEAKLPIKFNKPKWIKINEK